VAGGRRIPGPGEGIFAHGPLLQEEFALRVEDQDVDRAVPQAAPVHLAPWELTDDFVALVHDLKDFFAHVES
jgi:hypothetical protein